MRRRLWHTPKEIIPADACSAAIELRGDLDAAAEADLERQVVRAVACGATEIRLNLTGATNVDGRREQLLATLARRVRHLDHRIRVVDGPQDRRRHPITQRPDARPVPA